MSINYGSGNIDESRPAWPKDEYGKRDKEADDEWRYEREDRTYAFSVKMIRVAENGEWKKTYKTFRHNMLDPSERLDPDQKVDEFDGQGDEPSIPYRLPELVAARAADPDVLVLITEGERDVETARALGFVATTNPHGAEKWRDEYAAYLKGGYAAIIPDNDERGKKHADQVGVSVGKVASRLRVVDLPGTSLHDDLTSWVEYRRKTGMTDDAIAFDLRKLIDAAPDLDKWREQNGRLARDKAGTPLRTVENLTKVLGMMGVKVSHDDFNISPIVEGLTGHGPVLDDHALRYLRITMGTDFRLSFLKDEFAELVLFLAYKNRFHPVRDYLDTLVWDGVHRLETWLIDLAGATDNAYVRAVSKIVLVAAVRRVRQPGVKFDEMLVLESEQGKNKSTALTILAVRQEWFTDDVPLGSDTKQVIERLSGHWIGEAAELKGMRKGEIEHLKAFLSRRRDKARLAYGRMTTEVPRQSIFIGTTNNKRYLKDQTGNRRFWPVEVEQFNLEGLSRDRDQLWAEASALEAKGESIRLDESLWAEAAEAQAERAIEDPFVETLSAVLGDLQGKIQSEDVWTVVGIKSGQRNQEHNNRLGEAMQVLGWKKKKLRFGGPPSYAYVKGDAAHPQRIWIERRSDDTVTATLGADEEQPL